MTIIKTSDLDKQMGMQIDPNSVPRHDGGDQGAMAVKIAAGSEHIRRGTQELRRGSLVYNEKELGEPGFFGSQTVISVSASEELDARLDPNAVAPDAPAAAPVPPTPPPAAPTNAARTPAAILARLKYRRPLGT